MSWVPGHPAPQIPARPTRAGDLPAKLIGLLEATTTNGWTYTTFFSRGAALSGNKTRYVQRTVVLDAQAQQEMGKKTRRENTTQPIMVDVIGVALRHSVRKEAWAAWWVDGAYDAAVSFDGRRLPTAAEFEAYFIGLPINRPLAPKVVLTYLKAQMRPNAKRKAAPKGYPLPVAMENAAKHYDLTLEGVRSILVSAGLMSPSLEEA